MPTDIEEIKGDVFQCMNQAILNKQSEERIGFAHCISSDLAMSKGIATEVVRRYGGKALRFELASQGPFHVGDVGRTGLSDKVYHMITKEKYWGKPTYLDIIEAITRLSLRCREDKIDVLFMPRIGCGLDRLDWWEVKKILMVSDFTCKVVVCSL